MLGNCHHQQQQRQQIVSILSTSSGRQQNFPSINGDGDDKEFNNLQMSNHNNNNTNMIMPAATATTIARAINMDQKPNHIQDQPPVRCPRCDSTNTKFCYYNNYSLSQPRHFCKACKRYWTRGGTLRNVPVGGGCRRKNKRINNNNNKRIFSSSSSNTSTLADVGTTINPTFGGGDGGLTSHNNSTLLYGLPTNYLPYIGAANFPFSSNYDYDMNPSSYGFSTTNPKQIIHDLISSNPPNSSIISTFGSNTHPSSNMSLYPDTLLQQQHKFNFQPIFPNHTTTTTHHDEGLGVLQYPKEDDDDDNNVDRDGQYDDTHDTVKNMIDHSGYHHHHEYANLMDANHHHQQQHDQSESVVVAVTSSPHTSISWNNDDNSARTSGTTRISDGDGGGAHHLLDSTNNNNWLNPTYSAAAIGSSSSSIPS